MSLDMCECMSMFVRVFQCVGGCVQCNIENDCLPRPDVYNNVRGCIHTL